MSEQANPQPQFTLQRIYVKDISFESPNAPKEFLREWQPEMNLNIGTEVQQLESNNYEVILALTVTVSNAGQTAFLVEVKQAGIFQIIDIPKDQMGPVLGIACPNILFPYARETVSDLVTRGSFPQLLLSPVNFEQLYAQRVQELQERAAQAPSATADNAAQNTQVEQKH